MILPTTLSSLQLVRLASAMMYVFVKEVNLKAGLGSQFSIEVKH